jgi:membrane protease YdiL (CAAX protease family)
VRITPTSSPTSSRPSTELRPLGFAAWLGLAGGIVALGFIGRASGGTEENAFYHYDFAISSLLVYSVLAGLSIWIATAYGRPVDALGLRGAQWRWVGIACGFIVLALILASALEPFLHGGREQGLAPERWQPSRALPFALNGLVAATVVPLGEELFFRGLGVRALRFLGTIAAVVGTAVVFALGHAVLAALPPLVLFGLALGWVRLRADSIWPGVAAHGVYNGLAVVLTFATLQ